MNLEKKQKFLTDFAFGLTVLLAVIFVIKFMLTYLFPFIIGVVIAYIVQKPAKIIAEKIKAKKELCAAILSVLIYVLIIFIFVLVVWFLISRVNYLINYLSDAVKILNTYIDKIGIFLKDLSANYNKIADSTIEKALSDALSHTVVAATSFVTNTITAIIKNTPTFFVTAIVTVVATFYISKDYDRLKSFFIGIIAPSRYNTIINIKNIFSDCILKFIFGYLLLMLVTFLELVIGLFLLNVNHFLIVSLLISFVDLLPILGTGTVMLPWAVFLFLQGNYKLGFGIAFLFLLISIIRNFLEPKIIGDKMGINPIFTLAAMFLGLRLSGVVGMIMLPVALIVVYTFYRKKYIQA